MARYHDAIWEQVPEDRDVPDLEVRRRFLALLVSPGERVLDLGCGDGALLAELAELGARPVGADPSALALDRASRRVEEAELVRCEEGEPLPLPGGDFDGVWASEVLSHVADTGGLLAEGLRLLRPGGWIGITVPHHGLGRRLWEATAGFSRAHHPEHTTLRRYTRRTLAAQLAAQGFEEVRVRRAGRLPGSGGLVLGRARRPRGRGR